MVNNDTPWKGKLAGGKEKWDERKKLLKDVALVEIKRLCENGSYTIKSNEQYQMVDRDYQGAGAAFGVIGQLAAAAIAAANSEDANLPVAGAFGYECNNKVSTDTDANQK